MPFTIELDQEIDRRWMAEIPKIPGAMVYGQTREDAIAQVQILALRILADCLEHGEDIPAMVGY